MTSPYSDIISRLESAKGADRNLDAALWIACFDPEALEGEITIEPRGSVYAEREALCTAQGSCWVDELSPSLLRFTASIDAALMLVPTDFDYEVTILGTNNKETWTCASIKWWETNRAIDEKGWKNQSGNAKSAAIALCLASLRARAALEGKGK